MANLEAKNDYKKYVMYTITVVGGPYSYHCYLIKNVTKSVYLLRIPLLLCYQGLVHYQHLVVCRPEGVRYHT